MWPNEGLRNKNVMLGVFMIGLLLSSGGAIFAHGSVAAAASNRTQNEYSAIMHHKAPPDHGCFISTLPDTTWHKMPCAPNDNIPEAVGGGWGDYSANSGALTLISFTQGSFSSASVTSEYDTGEAQECSNPTCPGYYALQINSQFFNCTYSGSPATCWQQFVFRNSAATGFGGRLYMQYWLLNGYGGSTYGSPNCPTSNPGVWSYFWDSTHMNYDCFINSSEANPPNEDVTSQLTSLTMSGQSNLQDSGEDVVALCNGGTCYSVSAPDTVFSLYNYWHESEFGIYGYGASSEAIFNYGASITPAVQEENGNAGFITPVCKSIGGYTEEFNDRNLVSGSCSVSGTYEIMTFTESQ